VSETAREEPIGWGVWPLAGDTVVHVAPTYGPEHVRDLDGECWCTPHRERGRAVGAPTLLVTHREGN
jgi:hypothetical protein